ncbi:hypothetical protein KR222_008076, partial [Zaprionus bogoriensis]
MVLFLCRFLLPLFLILVDSSSAVNLTEIIDQLNTRLHLTTNIVYNPKQERLSHLREVQPVGQLIVQSLKEFDFNGSHLIHYVNDPVLFVLIVREPPLGLLRKLYLRFQLADFLLVISEPRTDSSADQDVRAMLHPKWMIFLRDAFQLGYLKLLLWHEPSSQLYEKLLFPKLKLEPITVSQYVITRDRLSDLQGFEVRVAAYSNPPRCMIYNNAKGEQVFGGYYMRLVRHFLEKRNATFVPVPTANDSPRHCIRALLSEKVDLCADALAQGSDRTFVVTNAIRMAYANVMVANAKPLSSYRYLVAPFNSTVWICLIVYIGLIVLFMSCIHWQQQHRWIYSKFLLETISSLLFSGFELRELQGHARYILFAVLFIAGFIYSTYYLGYLKSILTTEVFEEEINTFEQLIAANISLIIDEYDSTLSSRYNLPDILWQVIKVVPEETLRRHRTSFDQQYAYILFSDRMELYSYAQKYLRHPRLRRIPINIFFLFAGFPMRETWFLRHSLSDAWAWAFDSGLLLKLGTDADHEAMATGVGFLKFLVTEYYEATPLGLDYFVMPAMSLALGYSLAFISFVIELTVWR